jgi:hypothetical protein
MEIPVTHLILNVILSIVTPVPAVIHQMTGTTHPAAGTAAPQPHPDSM